MKDLNSIVYRIGLHVVHNFFPNFVFGSTLVAAVTFYTLSITGESPTWKNVASGSMALVGTLAGLAYREFMSKMRKMQKDLEEDRKKRDQQHKNNIAAIVALSMSTMDKMSGEEKENIKEMVHKLLEDKES